MQTKHNFQKQLDFFYIDDTDDSNNDLHSDLPGTEPRWIG